jgi:hypothetical protein
MAVNTSRQGEALGLELVEIRRLVPNPESPE